MLCPRHGISMHARLTGEVQYERCFACGGVWFGPRHLVSLDLPQNLLPRGLKALALAEGSVRGAPGVICHDCKKGLLRTKVEGVGVDICPSCGGAWLPSDEFEGVLAWYKERRKSKTERPSKTGSNDNSLRELGADFLRLQSDRDFQLQHGPLEAPVRPANYDVGDADEDALSAVVDFLSAVCRGIGEIASGLADQDGG